MKNIIEEFSLPWTKSLANRNDCFHRRDIWEENGQLYMEKFATNPKLGTVSFGAQEVQVLVNKDRSAIKIKVQS